LAEQAIAKLGAVQEHDDLAYLNSRLSQVARISGRQAEAENYSANAHEALGKHKLLQAYLREKVDWAVEPQESTG
jgi:hypothetical protein